MSGDRIPSELNVIIDYTNHRGERRERVIRPQSIMYCRSLFHEGEQWLLHAIDMEKMEQRSFAMKDIHSWRPA
jgi:predicted DNA-binding transcriptional regulator YafY